MSKITKTKKDFKIKCSTCGSKFSMKKNLYSHLRKFHQIEPLKSRPEPTFKCSVCEKKYSAQPGLFRHIRQNHQIDNDHNYLCKSSTRKPRIICPQDSCGEAFLSYVNLRQHLSDEHEIIIEYEELTFNSINDFEQWKYEMQSQTLSSYVQNNAIKSMKRGIYKVIFDCHRSYRYIRKGKNIRNIKTIGSNKTGTACPSRMELTSIQNDGELILTVKFWKTHCGHTAGQVARINLNKNVRLKIAEKLKQGVSFNEIMEGVHDSDLFDDISQRLRLKRKDLHNIVRDFNIDYLNKGREKDSVSDKVLVVESIEESQITISDD